MTHTSMMRLVSAVTMLGYAAAINNGLGRLPPMAWNTWCTEGKCGYDVCTEDEIKTVATAMQTSGMQAIGWNRINLDDCWEDVARDANGDIQADPTRFPAGMLSLSTWLHDRNFSFGIYTSLGRSVCNVGGHPTHPPGSYTHEVADVRTFQKWGVDYLKGDWCDAGGLPMEATTRTMANAVALVNTTWKNEPMWFMFHCEGTWATWCPELGESSRVSPDHFDMFSNGCAHGCGTGDIIDLLAGVGVHAGQQPDGGYWWPDWDLMMIGGQACTNEPNAPHCPGQTDTEYRTEFTFWSLASSPLVFATDPRNLTAIMREVLFNTELIAANQDPNPRPAMGAVRVRSAACAPASSAQCQVWHRAPGADGVHYVILYNPNAVGSGNVSFSFTWADAGLTQGTQARVRDMWRHADIGTFTNSYTTAVDIAPHEARALKVTPL